MELNNLIKDLKTQSLCWYPSSGLDLKALYYLSNKEFVLNSKNDFANELLYFENIPEIFVYTDKAYNNSNWPLNIPGLLSELEGVKYTLEGVDDITLNSQVVGKYLNVKISSNEVDKIQKVLFLFMDNLNFLAEFILENKVDIEFIINIRDGFSENGGSDYSMRFVEYLLGYLNCKYFISDNMGREPCNSPLIKNNLKIKNAINSPKNNHCVLQGLKEFTWSEYGVFQGDAFVMKVHTY